MSWKRPGLRKGDTLVVCDRSGFVIPSSQARKEWNGAVVDKRFWEARHPQDSLRVPRENMRVPDARPQPIDLFVGPLMTETVAAAAAGATTLVVVHTERMQGGDHIGVFLSDGDLHRTIIQTVVDLETLTLLHPLPGSVSAGAKVVNYTAIASSDLG
jgi:hypothetical protein